MRTTAVRTRVHNASTPQLPKLPGGNRKEAQLGDCRIIYCSDARGEHFNLLASVVLPKSDAVGEVFVDARSEKSIKIVDILNPIVVTERFQPHLAPPSGIFESCKWKSEAITWQRLGLQQ